MTLVRCNGCREWYDKKLGVCPHCETEPPAWNKWLRTAQLNNHLYDMARASRA